MKNEETLPCYLDMGEERVVARLQHKEKPLLQKSSVYMPLDSKSNIRSFSTVASYPPTVILHV